MNKKHEEALVKAWLAGFLSSGEGYNGEHPYEDTTVSDAPPDLLSRAITYAKLVGIKNG